LRDRNQPIFNTHHIYLEYFNEEEYKIETTQRLCRFGIALALVLALPKVKK